MSPQYEDELYKSLLAMCNSVDGRKEMMYFFQLAKTAKVFYFEPIYPDGDVNSETASFIRIKLDDSFYFPFWTNEKLLNEFIKKYHEQFGKEKILFNTVQHVIKTIDYNTLIIFNPYSDMSIKMNTDTMRNVI